MSQYSIKDLELLTGIKSHTLRIWESRYNIITPKRTASNIRYYLDEDLKEILNVAQLNKMGHKISKIAKMSDAERKVLILEGNEDCAKSENQIQCLIEAMLNFDEQRFNHILSNATLTLGFEKCMTKIVYPFLEKTGKLWQASSICVAQEHFVSALLKQKILAATDSQMVKESAETKRVLLFCPSGELHELNLLFTNYMLKTRDVHTLYLGADLPLCDLSKVYESYRPHYYVMSVTSGYVHKNIETLKNQLQDQLNEIPGFIIGAQCESAANWGENVHLAKSFEDIESHILSAK